MGNATDPDAYLAQLEELEEIDRAQLFPASSDDLTPAELEELELMSMEQVSDLSAGADDFEHHGWT